MTIEYRHNKEWDVLFIEDIRPQNFKEALKKEVKINNLGDIEVVDVQKIRDNRMMDGSYFYSFMVFYTSLTTKQEVIVR